MKEGKSASDYRYIDAANRHAHAYFPSTVNEELTAIHKRLTNAPRAKAGRSRASIHPRKGSHRLSKPFLGLRFEQGSAYDDLAAKYGRFPVVMSLEVVEHVYAPRDYARTLFDLVDPRGTAIVSTPCDGYLKNLALAVTGKMDRYFTALWTAPDISSSGPFQHLRRL